MARLPRAVFGGLPHLVQLRAQHGEQPARDAFDAARCIALMVEAARAEDVALHAWGLAADRLEMLLTPSGGEGLGRMVQALARRHSSAFNRRHGRHGSLWAGRYRAAVIEPGPWELEALLRVEAWDPPDGGAAASPWSSRAHHLGGGHEPRLQDPPAYWALGNTPFERQARYRDRWAQGLAPARAAAFDAALRGGWALGDPEFQAGLQGRIERPLRPRPAGRPRRPIRQA